MSIEATDNDEIALLNKNSVAVSSLVQLTQLCPIFCHCAECTVMPIYDEAIFAIMSLNDQSKMVNFF